MTNDVALYLSTLGPFQAIGVFGFLLYLWVFAWVQFGWMDGNCLTFSVANFAAAGCVGLGLLAEFNLSSALIQASYFTIASVGILRRIFRGSKVQASPQPLQEGVQ